MIKLEDGDKYREKDKAKAEYVIKKTARASMLLHALYDSQYNCTECNRFKMYDRLETEIINFASKFNDLNSIYQRLNTQEKTYFFSHKFTKFEVGTDYHIYVLVSESADNMLYQIADVMKTRDDDILRMCVFHSLDRNIMEVDEIEWYKMIEDRWGIIDKEFQYVNDTIKFLYRQKYGRDFDEGVLHF